MASAVTALGKLGIGAADPVTTLLNFRSFEPGINRMLKDTNATRGTFDKDTNRVRESRQMITPRLACEPTQAELLVLLPWLMGQAATGTTTLTYDLSNSVYSMYMYFLPVAGDQLFYSGVGVNSATLSATSGEAVGLDLDLLGQTYDDTRSNFPVLTPDQTAQPFLLTDLTLTFAGGTVQCREFSLRVDNRLDTDRFLNSLTLTRLQKLQRSISLTLDVPAGDNAGLWKGGLTGASLTAAFANAGASKTLTITSPAVVFPGQTPTYPPDQEGYLRVQGELYRTSGTSYPLRITMTA